MEVDIWQDEDLFVPDRTDTWNESRSESSMRGISRIPSLNDLINTNFDTNLEWVDFRLYESKV